MGKAFIGIRGTNGVLNQANTVNYLDVNSPITEQLSWDNNNSQLIIREPKFEILYYDVNSNGDSLIGSRENHDKYCLSMPLDNQYYIPFKKTIGTQYKYGWILLDIIDNNKITIYKSVIQNEYN